LGEIHLPLKIFKMNANIHFTLPHSTPRFWSSRILKRDEETVWMCCYCSQGPYNVQITTTCYNCGHELCGNCSTIHFSPGDITQADSRYETTSRIRLNLSNRLVLIKYHRMIHRIDHQTSSLHFVFPVIHLYRIRLHLSMVSDWKRVLEQ
jgi:hypothetical protein